MKLWEEWYWGPGLASKRKHGLGKIRHKNLFTYSEIRA